MKRYFTFNLGLTGCFLMFSLFLTNRLHSQVSLQWARTYGTPINRNDQSRAMVTDDLGNVYITGGSAGSNNKLDYVTIKYNTSGVVQWVARYDGFNGDDYAKSIAIDKSGNLFVTGYSEDNNSIRDIATVKYNNAGIQQWVARFNGPANGFDEATNIKVDQEGNVYVAGYASVPEHDFDYATIKYNNSGIFQWVRYYNGSANGQDVIFSMALDPVTSDVYVTGHTTETNSEYDYTTIKYNSSGTEVWVRKYNGPANSNDDARVLTLDLEGNVIVSGYSIAPGNAYDCATIKYNASGSILWIMRYPALPNGIFQPMGIKTDKMNNIYIVGFTQIFQNRDICVTLKYNSQGIQQWVRFYNGPPNDFHNIGLAIALDSHDNVYVAGQSDGGSTSIDYITIKYDPDGVEKWVQRYDSSNFINIPSAIVVNKFDEVFVTGSIRTYADITGDYYDYLTLKYVQPTSLHVNAGADTLIYDGYGSGCATLKAVVSGGVPPYTYSWTPAGNNPTDPVNTVCPKITTKYRVTVTDANQATATDTMKVTVINVRCGNKKVIVCHNGHSLCIPEQAVAVHLNHGDKLGLCPFKFGCHIDNGFVIENGTNPGQQAETYALPGMSKEEELIGKISNYPNPFRSVTTINYVVPFDAHVSIRVYDMMGKEVAVVVNEDKKAGNYNILFAAGHLTSGTYQCNIIANSKDNYFVQSIKLNVIR